MVKKGVSRRGFLKLFGIVPAAPKIIKGFLESPAGEIEFDSSACRVDPEDIIMPEPLGGWKERVKSGEYEIWNPLTAKCGPAGSDYHMAEVWAASCSSDLPNWRGRLASS